LTTTEVDPWRHAATEQYNSGNPGYDDPVTGYYSHGRRCIETDDGYNCTRPLDHPPHWQHIAGGASYINHTWGGDDIFGDVEVGQNIREHTCYRDRAKGARVREEYWCGARVGGSGHFCTRHRKHDLSWQHISVSASGEVLAVKPFVSGPYVETVPPDGSAVDSPDRVLTAAPEPSTVLKLRDRDRYLYVIDSCPNGTVETLDLTDLAYKVIPRTHLVRTDRPLMVEDLPRIQGWFNTHRKEVRRVGIEKMRANLWCRPGLDDALQKMGLPPYEPELRGTATIQLPFVAQRDDLTRSAAREQIRRIMETEEFRQLFAGVEDLDPEWANASPTVGDMYRS
jgi:hypothetical protein